MRREDEQLAALLRAVGRDLEPSVDLTDAVLDRIRSEATTPPARRRRSRWPLLVIIPALLLGGCMSIPQFRSAVLEVLHLKGITVTRGTLPPSPTSTSYAEGPPSPAIPAPGQIGTQTTLKAVETWSHGSLLVPTSLGAPRQVWREGAMVNLLYGTDLRYPSYVITEILEPSRPILQKIITPSTTVQRVQIGDVRGYWIVGPQGLAYLDAAGVAHFLPSLFGAHSLLWDLSTLTARIETFKPESAAVAVARSMH
jgi:hypothetical protein